MRKNSFVTILPLIGVAVSIFLLVASVKYLGLEEDSPLEEAIEEVIQATTGVDVDLTPNSPEGKDGNEQTVPELRKD